MDPNELYNNFFLELYPAVRYISCGAACFAAPQEDAATIGASTKIVVRLST